MTTALPAVDHETLHEALRAWNEREETLDDQLAESLAALEAYQSHLDAWQRDLAEQRRALAHDRQQFAEDRTAAKDATARLEKAAAELNDARTEVAALSKSLLERTVELRQLDVQRAELATQLEVARARERELAAKVDGQGGPERVPQWAEEFKQLRELLERQTEPGEVDEAMWELEQAEASEDASATESPVLGSLVQQFGKLRQQRSQGQRSRKRTG